MIIKQKRQEGYRGEEERKGESGRRGMFYKERRKEGKVEEGREEEGRRRKKNKEERKV